MGDLFGKKNIGACVEVGGYDGITGSNTYFFEKTKFNIRKNYF